MTILDLTQLSFVTGGQQAAAPQPSAEDRTREIVREERDFEEKEELRAFEKRHPFTAMLCQGDRDCLRDARR